MSISFDIIIASYNRPHLLEKCLSSIFSQKSESLCSVVVLTQREDTETIELIKSYIQDYNIELVLTDNKLSPGASRNILIKKTTAEYIHFLDDDAFVPEAYYSISAKFLTAERFDVMGGPDQSPIESSTNQHILGDVLASFFVMGPTSTRHKIKTQNNSNATEIDLTLCNLWMRSSIFKEDHLYFDEELMRCEENILLDTLNEKKLNIVYLPSLFIYHFRRESLVDLAKIQFKSGIYRGLSFYKGEKSFKLLFIFPLMTGLLLISFPLLPEFIQIFLILSHTVFSIIVSFKIMISNKSIKAFFLSWYMIVVIHFFFSVGLAFGTIKGRFSK